MAKLSKFIRGPRVKDMNDLLFLLDGGCWIYLHHKAYHPNWISRMPLFVVCRYVKEGRLEQAIRRVQNEY